MTDLEKAIALAVRAHTGQVDKNGEPYILHPLRVMLSFEADDLRTIAVLHDVVEDTHVTFGHLALLVSSRVLSALYDLTKVQGEEYMHYIGRCAGNPLARRVKIADLKDNMRSGAESLKDRYKKALEYLEGIETLSKEVDNRFQEHKG